MKKESPLWSSISLLIGIVIAILALVRGRMHLPLLLAVWLRWRWLAARRLRGIDALQIPEHQGRLRVLSPRLLSFAHSLGVEVHVWTVNEAIDMRRLLNAGVDGLITDRADIALAIVAEWAQTRS